MANVTVRDVVGEGPRHPNPEHVTSVVEQIRDNPTLQENFYLNFEGLASQLEGQAQQGRGMATKELRETCACQAANVRRFVAAVRKRLGG